jgi:tetratricopeptide (TPR) repeat protein
MSVIYNRCAGMGLVLAVALALILHPSVAAAPPTLAEFESMLQKDPDNLRLGADYRQAIIAVKQFDRAIKFFKDLVRRNPRAQNAHINYGFAYIDKIPDASGFSQPFLGRDAINQFGKALQLGQNWLALYVRGLVYLYYKPFMRVTHHGVDHLERALAIQRRETHRSYHVHTFVALGDGYWKMNDLTRATAVWREGLALFPLDADVRIDTSLSEFWTRLED